jgi:hypothetical protein
MIEIDLTEIVPHEVLAMLSDAMVVHALDDVVASAHAKWIRLAQTELHSSRQTYIQGIQRPESTGPFERTITLVGWLPNAIESGMSAFDLRETLLGPGSSIRKPIMKAVGKNSRSGATMYEFTGGYYAHIPFRHGTPGSSGLAGGPMGGAYGEQGALSRAVGGGKQPGGQSAIMSTARAHAFGEAVHAAAKAMRARHNAGNQRHAADRLHVPGPLLKAHHKTSIYHGMVKVRKPYRNPRTQKTTVQSQYATFRTISDSVSTGWMHPGIEPRHLSKQVEAHAARVTHAIMRQLYNQAAKGGS